MNKYLIGPLNHLLRIKMVDTLFKNGIHEEWAAVFAEDQFASIIKKIQTELLTMVQLQIPLTPPLTMAMRVFRMPINQVRVIIVGQDPYTGTGQANGLAFGYRCASLDQAVRKSTPPSIINVIEASGCEDTTLISWFTQGVFLINRALTASPDSKGASVSIHEFWFPFTELVVKTILERSDPNKRPPCMLWGNKAKMLTSLVISYDSAIFSMHHPSKNADICVPEESRWARMKDFSGVNNIIKPPITWTTKPLQFSWPTHLFFTDGACIDNGKLSAKAGCGVVLLRLVGGNPRSKDDVKYELVQELGLKLIPSDDPSVWATNQRAELQALAMALNIIAKSPGVQTAIVTDSDYALKLATGEFKATKNLDLVAEIVTLYNRHVPLILHINSHQYSENSSSDITSPTNYMNFFQHWNDVVDKLATKHIG
jgi:uracil-DNA glycosylase